MTEKRTVLPESIVDFAEDSLHAFLGIVVFAIALISIYFGFRRYIDTQPSYPNAVIQSVNDLLFVIIVLEILRTVIGRFSDGSYQLENFLIIGVIASVRSILTVGATLTLGSEISDDKFDRLIKELIVSAIITLILVSALFISKQTRFIANRK